MFIAADDPVGRVNPYLRVDTQALYGQVLSPSANRSFGPLRTDLVTHADMVLAAKTANNSGVSGISIAGVTGLGNRNSNWAYQGGQGAETSFDPRSRFSAGLPTRSWGNTALPSIIHPSMTRFVPPPQVARIQVVEPEPPPPSPPVAIPNIASRLPDISPGPGQVLTLKSSFEDVLNLKPSPRTARCAASGLSFDTPSMLTPSDTGSGATVPYWLIAAGLGALYLALPQRRSNPGPRRGARSKRK